MHENKVKKPWYKKWWGIIALVCVWPASIIWYIWKKTNWRKDTKIGISVVFGLIFLFSTIAASSKPAPAPQNVQPVAKVKEAEKTKPVAVKKEEPKADSSDLKLTVKPTIFGLYIESTETADLKNCTIKINPGIINSGYSMRSDLTVSPTTLNYAFFTKDAERFDVTKYAVKDVSISSCAGMDSRLLYVSAN